MAVKHFQRFKGALLLEVMIAILLLSVAVLGAAGYRYYATLDARKSNLQVAAARTALLLCESWRGVEGTETYDPVAYFGSELTITYDYGPVAPGGFTTLGSYAVTLDGVNYYLTLSWKDVSAGLRALNVVVSWQQRPSGEYDGYWYADKSFKLTTYTQI